MIFDEPQVIHGYFKYRLGVYAVYTLKVFFRLKRESQKKVGDNKVTYDFRIFMYIIPKTMA